MMAWPLRTIIVTVAKQKPYLLLMANLDCGGLPPLCPPGSLLPGNALHKRATV